MNSFPKTSFKDTGGIGPMAKIQVLNYITDTDEVLESLSTRCPEIEPRALPALIEEIKFSALMHACAWLSSHDLYVLFAYRKDLLEERHLFDNVFQNIQFVAERINDKNWTLEENQVLLSKQFGGFRWAVSTDTWLKAVSSFTCHLILTVLRCTDGIMQLLERYNGNTLTFSPQKIWCPHHTQMFTFSISIFNRELLSAPQ